MSDDDSDHRFDPMGLLRRCRQDFAAIVGVLAMPFICGCSPAKNVTPSRLHRGYTIILPGIEGTSYLNADIARGLVKGNWPGAVEVYDWTAGSVLLFPVNLRALERNKEEAGIIADKIRTYQARYPGRPVHIIGHSGGGGVAVLALEALPPGREITSAILLAPAISPNYDLTKAMKRTRFGIWNFYSRYDVGFLKAGTTFMGTIDGEHTAAAGAVGFRMPVGLDADDRRLYATKLRQQSYSKKMADSGHEGSHTGWANSNFVAQWLCPIMIGQAAEQNGYVGDIPVPPSVTVKPDGKQRPNRRKD